MNTNESVPGNPTMHSVQNQCMVSRTHWSVVTDCQQLPNNWSLPSTLIVLVSLLFRSLGREVRSTLRFGLYELFLGNPACMEWLCRRRRDGTGRLVFGGLKGTVLQRLVRLGRWMVPGQKDLLLALWLNQERVQRITKYLLFLEQTYDYGISWRIHILVIKGAQLRAFSSVFYYSSWSYYT